MRAAWMQAACGSNQPTADDVAQIHPSAPANTVWSRRPPLRFRPPCSTGGGVGDSSTSCSRGRVSATHTSRYAKLEERESLPVYSGDSDMKNEPELHRLILVYGPGAGLGKSTLSSLSLRISVTLRENLGQS